MSRFDEYITGLTEVTIGKEELKLDIIMDDKRKLKTMASKGGDLNEKALKIMDDCFINILKRSYPDESEEALTAFYNDNDIDFMNTIFIKFKWIKPEDLQQKK